MPLGSAQSPSHSAHACSRWDSSSSGLIDRLSIGCSGRRLPAWCLAAHEARKPDADVRGPRAIAILQKAALLVFANAKPPDLSGRFSCCTDCRIRCARTHTHRPMVWSSFGVLSHLVLSVQL